MKQVRMGIIGTGLRSGIAKHWHQPEGESIITGVADINPENLEKFKEKVTSDCFTTDSYVELLKRDDIDAVAILSPDYLHEEHAVAALKAGKHVYCEKPLAITEAGCDRIMKTAEETGKHLMVGFNMRYMRMFQTMKGIVDSGVIGDIKAVWVRHFVGYGGYFYYHDWHGLSKNTTSLLLQKGSHDIDIIHWIAGAYTKRVSAFGSLSFYGGDKPNDLTCPTCDIRDTCTEASPGTLIECAFREEIDVEDNNVVIMELENGIKASYLQCHFTPDYHRNYTFIGTKGRMENSEPDGKVYVKTRKSNSWEEFSDQTYDIKPAEGGHGGADPVICKEFIDLVLHGKEPIPTPLDGRMSVAVGCAATESIRNNGKVIEVNRPT
ncbi:Gfo/Idh/MocA family oxidoreductase [Ornithinibacillus gellani]|uniref:Gfo/Idh/MocA family protein n=1 Tax=Ornithinibacillus gellani TaxID=2293253 RepID=UPI000F486DED|nr:Gfo/Idh/MocA family oxidoreductase [Ornithinibacillus gellani]TQS75004.1 Gfo/Idh/MocA family oxidoreductase [Ornithinibacillus gellani]